MSSKESPVAAESAKLMEGKNNDGFPEEDKRSLCSRLCSACCSRCCRLLLAFILFPFVIVMTLLAVIVWLLLLPCKYIVAIWHAISIVDNFHSQHWLNARHQMSSRTINGGKTDISFVNLDWNSLNSLMALIITALLWKIWISFIRNKVISLFCMWIEKYIKKWNMTLVEPNSFCTTPYLGSAALSFHNVSIFD